MLTINCIYIYIDALRVYKRVFVFVIGTHGKSSPNLTSDSSSSKSSTDQPIIGRDRQGNSTHPKASQRAIAAAARLAEALEPSNQNAVLRRTDPRKV